ncbi:MAG TPA: alpha/beta hydrolase [Nevskiaceae bacterium]|nr:alpha/beta hydrolase [Nevskiaceae bacterium]
MRATVAPGIELEYESFGRERDPAVLLVMGLACQLTHWPEPLCQRLAAAGYRVIRFDNRDIGLSTRFGDRGRPSIPRTWLRRQLGLPARAAYTLEDMAGDVLGLMDALGLAQAHVVGASMGGMIAQHLAVRAPQRLASLGLIMTTSGARGLPQAHWKLQLRMIRRPEGRDRDSLIRHSVRTWQLIGSPAYPVPEEELTSRIAGHFDRSYHPAGVLRQLDAILASGSRARLVKQIRTPTLVLHGQSDPLVPVAAAHDLARRIPNARLHLFPGMGHDLPTPLLGPIADQLLGHFDAARARRAAA